MINHSMTENELNTPIDNDESEILELDTTAAFALIIHDVKNSLALVGAELEEIESTLDVGSDAAKQVHRVGLENTRINNALMHLLGLYRQEKHLIQPHIESVFVREVLEDAVSRMVVSARKMNIEVTIHADEDLQWFLDPLLLENMLNNTLTNSLRYTKDRIDLYAKIEKDAEHDGHEIMHVWVKDNGRGFPDNIINFIDKPQTDMNFAGGSTGIGLYLSHSVARMHENKGIKGKVVVSNDDGARVDFWLP
jgi:signal transduction histidine kinase